MTYEEIRLLIPQINDNQWVLPLLHTGGEERNEHVPCSGQSVSCLSTLWLKQRLQLRGSWCICLAAACTQVLESAWTDSLNRHKVGSTKTGGRGTAGLKKTAKGHRHINVPASTNFTIMLHFLISKIEGIFSLFFHSEKAREHACIWARNAQNYKGSWWTFAKGMEEQHGTGDQASAPGRGGWALPLAQSESLVYNRMSSPLWFFLCRMKEGQFVQCSED